MLYVYYRRKPQNLTPPGSSDTGSSGSGQSPTSTHPGSPPPPVTSSVKRPGYIEGVDGLPTKRARISHYRKPEPLYSRPAQPAAEQRRPPTDSRDTSNMNPRSREPYLSTTTLANGYTLSINGNNGYCSSTTPNDKRQYSDEENDVANRKRSCDSHINSISYTVNREKTIKENSICNSPNKNPMQDELRLGQGKESPLGRMSLHRRTDSSRQEREREEREREREKERERERERKREEERTRWNKVSSTTHNGNSVSRVSPDSQTDRIAQAETTRPPPNNTPASPSPTQTPVHRQSNTVAEFPDYLT